MSEGDQWDRADESTAQGDQRYPPPPEVAIEAETSKSGFTTSPDHEAAMIEWVFGKAWNDMKVEDPANYRLLKDFMKNPNAKRTPGDQPFVHFGSEDFFSPYWGYWKKWASKLNVSEYRVKKRLVRSFNDYIERLKALKTRIDGLRFK